MVESETKKLVKQTREKVENFFGPTDMKGKQMLEEIPEKTLKFIQKQRFVSRTTLVELDSSSENTGLIEEEYSMEFLKLLGYKNCDKGEIFNKLLKFDIQRSYSTEDFLATILKTIFGKKKYDDESEEIKNRVVNQDLIVRGKGENAFSFTPMMWEEKWIG